MLSCWMRVAAACLLWVALGSVPASAHDLPLDRFMNGFVRIEPHQADLVMRIPLDLLRAVSFPIVGGHYDLAASQPAIRAALSTSASAVSWRCCASLYRSLPRCSAARRRDAWGLSYCL